MAEIRSLLVTVDNFWIGGRETFLAANLGELRRREGTEVRLLATDARGAAAGGIFDEVMEMGPLGEGEWAQWVTRGSSALRERPGDLIWAQHFRVLPAWWLSRTCGVPLLATFHGPLSGAGRPGTPADALGIALAIHGGGVLSAVSEEVAESLAELGAAPERIRQIPNRVRVEGATTPPPRDPLRVLLLSRQEKLGHLRAAVRFFHHFRRRVGKAELVVHAGTWADERAANGAGALRRASAAARRLGRRWLAEHPELIVELPRIRFAAPTPDPAAAMRAAHVVLGMGRVVLEGVAAGRPAVLVGYDHLVGVVNDGSFRELARRNFSGRGAPPADPERVAEQVERELTTPSPAPGLLAAIDLERNWPETRAVLAAAMEGDRQHGDAERAAKLEALMTGGAEEREWVEAMLPLATAPERNTFEHLFRG